MDPLHQGTSVPLRKFGVSAHTHPMLPRRMRARLGKVLEERWTVGANSPKLLDGSATLPAMLANKAIRAAIEESLLQAPELDVLHNLREFPEAAATRPLPRDNAAAGNDSLCQGHKVVPQQIEVLTELT